MTCFKRSRRRWKEGGREGGRNRSLLTSSRGGRRPSACLKAAERGLSVPKGYLRVNSSQRRMPEGGKEGGREGRKEGGN